MKVLLIEGSPRKVGNGAIIADAICQKYSTTTRIRLWDLDYKGCSACRLCRKAGSSCQVQDGLTSVFAELAVADCIILISPNYCGSVSGEVKQFIDRLYYSNQGKGDNKTVKEGTLLFFIQTIGSGNTAYGSSVSEWLKGMSSRHGLKYYGMTVPNCSHDDNNGAMMKIGEIVSSLAFMV